MRANNDPSCDCCVYCQLSALSLLKAGNELNRQLCDKALLVAEGTTAGLVIATGYEKNERRPDVPEGWVMTAITYPVGSQNLVQGFWEVRKVTSIFIIDVICLFHSVGLRCVQWNFPETSGKVLCDIATRPMQKQI